MKFFNLIPYYFAWHYGKSLVAFVFLLSDILGFICNFFSIKTLFLNLFLPKKKLDENDTTDMPATESKFHILTGIIFTALLRSLIIVIGIIVWFSVLIFGVIAFFVWLFLPFILLLAFVLAVASLFRIQNV